MRDFTLFFVTSLSSHLRQCKEVLSTLCISLAEKDYGAFSHDVTSAILVFQNNETAAMLVFQTNPVRGEPFS